MTVYDIVPAILEIIYGIDLHLIVKSTFLIGSLRAAVFCLLCKSVSGSRQSPL